jgi:hypothetical protein
MRDALQNAEPRITYADYCSKCGQIKRAYAQPDATTSAETLIIGIPYRCQCGSIGKDTRRVYTIDR